MDIVTKLLLQNMELIYILTYDCNFRCRYCDIHKRDQKMPPSVIKESLNFIDTLRIPIEKVKFFWWEPLLEKDSIRTIVKNFPKKQQPIFMVTTNTSLVDDEFMAFASQYNIRTTFSIDGNNETNKENRGRGNSSLLFEKIVYNTQCYAPFIQVNQVITSANAKNIFKNFRFIYDLWVRKFNFLPEYYREWTKQWLEDLKRWFDEILNFYRKGNNFWLVNLDNFSETPFFNLWITIDTDGQIYGTNLILSGVFEKHKKNFVIGNTSEWITPDFFRENFQRLYIDRIHSCIQKEYPPAVLRSVEYTDLILNHFVREYQAYWTQHRKSVQ